MSILSSVNKSILQTPNGPATFIDPSEYRSQLSDMFSLGDGGTRLFSYSGHKSSLKAYQKCPPVTSIINKKAQSYINGKTWILNKDGKESQNEYAKKLRKLLSQPNPFQSWKQFEAQQYIFCQLSGWCLCLPIIPAGFEKFGAIEASALYNIPPLMLDITETNKLFYQTDLKGVLKSVKLTYRGDTTELAAKNFFIFKDVVPSFQSMIFPESRICSVEMPINNIMGAYESRNVLINYRGALGIISSESDKNGYIPIKDDDKLNLQSDFKRYGLTSQQWKFIITSAAVKWQQMGIPTKDLMLFEEIEGSTMAICDQFNYPYRLMAAEKSASYNDVKEFKGMLYQDAIIPEAESMYEQWTNMFNLSQYGIRLDKDFSHVAVLQEDKSKSSTARKTMGEELDREFKNNWITLNRVLEILGEDTLGDIGNKYYRELVAEGWVFGSQGTIVNNPTDNQNPPANGN